MANWIARWIGHEALLRYEFESKIFGDMSKDLAAMFFDKLGEIFKVDDSRKMNAKKVAYSPNTDAFGENLFAEVAQQRKAVAHNLNKITQDINNSVTFGQALVKRLQR